MADTLATDAPPETVTAVANETTSAATDGTQSTVTTGADELSVELINPGRVVICITFPVARVSFFDAAGEPAGQSDRKTSEVSCRP